MAKRTSANIPLPTNAELEILGALWKLGPATVRDVHEHLDRYDKIGYTTVLKLLQNMHAKGLVLRQDSQRSHVYSPAYKRDDIVRGVTKNFVDRVFSGSRSELVLHALRAEDLSVEEIDEISRALQKIKSREA